MKRAIIALILPVAALWQATAAAPASMATSLDSLASALMEIPLYNAQVEVEVTLPMASNDQVDYTVKASALKNETDSLLPLSYLLDWSLTTPSGESHGFAAYFNGNNYRYRDGVTISEYHADVDLTPFLTVTPVQKTVQFFDILPWAIGNEIRRMAADSTFTLWLAADTVFGGEQATVLLAQQSINGMEAAEMKYVFDRSTKAPVYVEKEMSPGTISEQTVEYRYTTRSAGSPPVDEEQLVALYPEAFSLFRDGNYALKSLVGRDMPSFSLPTLQGGRVSHTRGEATGSPVIIAFVDETVGSTPLLLESVDKAVGALPMNVEVLWVFLSNRQDDIARLVDEKRVSGTVLTSGRNITKDFGVTRTPSLIFVDRKGKVADVVDGLNNNIDEIVIQKTALLN